MEGFFMKRLACSLVLLIGGSISVVAIAQHGAMDNLNRMFETMSSRMEQQFNSMFERMERLDEVTTYTRNASVTEDNDSLRVVIPVDKQVAPKDVIIDLDNGVLHVLIEKPERVEIIVEERWLTLTAERHESKDQNSAVSYASQQLTLPLAVDVSKVTADLTDGSLTLLFEKNPGKNRQRIQVTQGGSTSRKTSSIITPESAKKTGDK